MKYTKPKDNLNASNHKKLLQFYVKSKSQKWLKMQNFVKIVKI